MTRQSSVRLLVERINDFSSVYVGARWRIQGRSYRTAHFTFHRYIPLVALVLLTSTLGAQPDLDGIGPAVGTRVPDFSGIDQFGRAQSLQSVSGPEGAMVVFFRSADW